MQADRDPEILCAQIACQCERKIMAKKLYVSNLSYDTTNETLRAAFEAVGQVATVDLAQAAAPLPADGVTNLDSVVAVGQFVPETTTSEVATYVSMKQIDALPQNSRNFLAFADTVPGMVFSDDGNEARLRSGAQGASQISGFCPLPEERSSGDHVVDAEILFQTMKK